MIYQVVVYQILVIYLTRFSCDMIVSQVATTVRTSNTLFSQEVPVRFLG